MAKSILFEQMPKGSISEIIIDRITQALVSGELKPGDKIPTETEFSERLGVGRNAVREAIKVLVAFGVLEIRRAEGTFVVSEYNRNLLNPMIYGLILSEHNMEELLNVKLALSTSIMYIAMKEATDAELTHLRVLGQRFSDLMKDHASNRDDCYHASMEFNVFLSEITHNRMLDQLDAIIHKVAKFTRNKAIERSKELGEPMLLPDNYMKEVDILERRSEAEVLPFMDERLEIWKKLLL
jgi:DNA-binding FadR family transcriptional regulator